MRSLVEKQFGPNAAAYATSQVHAKGESIARLVEIVKPRRHWHVLDVATGAGHTGLAFAPHVERVVASDMTAEMLDQAAKLAAGRGLANVETVIAVADALPFADASFDLAVCRLAAHHFPEPQKFFAEAARVLRPGGTLGFVDNIAPDAVFPGQAGPDEIAATDRHYDAFERQRDPSHGRTLTLSEIQSMAVAAGLQVSHAERLAKPMAFLPWAERQGCSAATIEKLGADLEDPLLARFLTPHTMADGLWFTLQECVVAAHRAL